MCLSIEVLTDKLKSQYNLQCYINSNKQRSVRAIWLLSNGMVIKPDVLYVTKATELHEFLPLQCAGNFLSIGDPALSPEVLANANINLFVVDENTDAFELLRNLQNTLVKNLRPPSTTMNLLNTMICSRGIQQIIDIGFELLGNPMFVTDANHKLLAYTKNIKIDDPEWHYIVEKGFVSFDKATAIFKEVMEMARKFPVIDDDGKMSIPFLRKLITINDKVAAFLTVPGYFKPFDEFSLEIAELLGNVILKELQNNKITRFAKGSMCESFIIDLLSRKILDQSIIRERLNFLDWNLKEFIYVLTVRTNQSPEEIESISIIDTMKALQELMIGSRTVLYNNDIVVVFSRPKEILQPETQLNDLVELVCKKRLYAGISRSTRTLVDIHDCYCQSVKAMEIGTSMVKNSTIFVYEDYAVYHLLDICAAQKNLNAFCHPSLLTLAEYDQKNATVFLHSLRTYLENDKNLGETATALHIHRNTLSYRISKIAEIMKLDLNDSNVTLQLFLSFKIMGYTKDDLNYKQL